MRRRWLSLRFFPGAASVSASVLHGGKSMWFSQKLYLLITYSNSLICSNNFLVNRLSSFNSLLPFYPVPQREGWLVLQLESWFSGRDAYNLILQFVKKDIFTAAGSSWKSLPHISTPPKHKTQKKFNGEKCTHIRIGWFYQTKLNKQSQ